MPATRAVLESRVKILRDSVIQSCGSDIGEKELKNFALSTSWVVKIVECHSSKFKLISGEGDSFRV